MFETVEPYGPMLPGAISAAAHDCLMSVRNAAPGADIRFEICFKPHLLRRLLAQWPDVLRVQTIHGRSVTFPERPALATDFEVDAIAERGEQEIARVGRGGPVVVV